MINLRYPTRGDKDANGNDIIQKFHFKPAIKAKKIKLTVESVYGNKFVGFRRIHYFGRKGNF